MERVKKVHKTIEVFFENCLFFSRWFLAPVFLLCPLLIVIVGIKFLQQLYELITTFLYIELQSVLSQVVEMMDMTLVMGLIVVVMFSGYENFVSKLDVEDHADNPVWIRSVSFSKMKILLIATIVAMTSLRILIEFYQVNTVSSTEFYRTMIIHIVLVFTAIGMALMDKILHSVDKEH